MDESLRLAYLEALGIPVWVPRDRVAHVGLKADLPASVQANLPADRRGKVQADVQANPTADPRADSQAAHPHTRGPDDIDALGSAFRPTAIDPDVSVLDWDALRARVAACTACELHCARTQTVFGVGNPVAQLMIVGEAPGADEDRQGEPFVGRAGKLLDAMLKAIGLPRGEVYIANVLKCRPPGNRNPALAEAAACEGFLRRQIALVGPKLILSVGGIAARNLLGTDTPVGKLRGMVHEYGTDRVPVLVTYHPAYLLRQPEEKAKAWQDLQLAARLLRSG